LCYHKTRLGKEGRKRETQSAAARAIDFGPPPRLSLVRRRRRISQSAAASKREIFRFLSLPVLGFRLRLLSGLVSYLPSLFGSKIFSFFFPPFCSGDHPVTDDEHDDEWERLLPIPYSPSTQPRNNGRKSFLPCQLQ